MSVSYRMLVAILAALIIALLLRAVNRGDEGRSHASVVAPGSDGASIRQIGQAAAGDFGGGTNELRVSNSAAPTGMQRG